MTARVLNLFKEDRLQSKAFHRVQERSTIRRYTRYWSRLIVFLLYLISQDDKGPFGEVYLEQNDILRDLVWNTSDCLHAMLAIDLADVDLDELFQATAGGEDREEQALGIPSAIFSHALQLHIAIEDLSFYLVRFPHEESPFASPIVGFMALNTLQRNGAWIAAHNFTFLLSGMIHCMQLWLLGYCCQAQARMTRSSSTLEAVVRGECKNFLVNTKATPMAELLYWRLLTWTASNDTVRHPVTTVNASCTQVNHLGIELEIGSWRQALQDLFNSAEGLLQKTLLLGLSEVPVYQVGTLVDTPSDHRPGKCFLDDHRNRLHAVDGYLFKQLQGNPTLVSRFFLPNASGTEDGGCPPPLRVRHSAVNAYLHANQLFLQQLAVLIYWSAGLPPRRKEFVQVQWCNGETIRNIYILDGSVVIITGYHKSQWRIGTRPVARFLPPRVGNLLVRYLIYIPSFLQFLYHCMQYAPCRGFLFADEHGVWLPDRFGDHKS